MRVRDNRMSYVFRIAILWVILTLVGIVTGCGSTQAINVDYSQSLKKSKDSLSLIYDKKFPDARFIEFIGDKAVVGGLGKVQVIDLKSSKSRTIAFTERLKIVNVQPSKDKQRLLIAVSGKSIEIFDTQTWKVLRRFKGSVNRFENGMSPDGKMVYFDEVLWSVDSGKKIMAAPADSRTSVHTFTPDSRYFIEGGYDYSFQLIDLKKKQDLPSKTKVEKVSNIIVRKDNHFYAGYESRTDWDDGGYYASLIGLFDHLTNDKIKSVSFSHPVSCWNTMPDDSLFVVLGNGDVTLLDKQLKATAKWNLPGLLQGNIKTRLCAAGPDHSIWLAKGQSGLYRINPNQRTLSNPDTTKNIYDAMAVSKDGKYLGFSRRNVEGGNTVKIFRVR